jgi:hypothetical protein
VLEHDPEVLGTDPDNFCARARLAATAQNGRTEHFLWMIRNHPDWEGLAIWPNLALGGIRPEPLDVAKVKQAWEEQISLKASPQVLHNAALFFFRANEPYRAIELLERARSLQPKMEVWNYLDGLMYGSYLNRVYQHGDVDWDFVIQAAQALRSSNDPTLLRGAALVGAYTGSATAVRLNERARAIQPEDNYFVSDLPFFMQNCQVRVKY